jgi:hypothetical protein
LYKYTLCLFTDKKKFPISFSTEEYSVLYNIQKLSLYSGGEVKNLLQLNEIIRSFIVVSWLIMTVEDDKLRMNYLRRFYRKRGLPENSIPKNPDELLVVLKKRLKEEEDLFQSLIEHRSNLSGETIRADKYDDDSKSNDFKNLMDQENMIGQEKADTKKRESNYIMSVDEEEFEELNKLRALILACLYQEDKNTSLSLSELVRETLSFLFLTKDTIEDPYHLRMDFLAFIYIGNLYNLRPSLSLKIFFHFPKGFMIRDESKEDLETLKLINRDSVIFEALIKEIQNTMSLQEGATKSVIRGKRQKKFPEILGFSDNYKNVADWHWKYKSSISGFSFISAILGLKLMIVEWETKQHELPITSALAFSWIYKHKETIGYSALMDQRALISFKSIIEELLEISKKYRENGVLE